MMDLAKRQLWDDIEEGKAVKKTNATKIILVVLTILLLPGAAVAYCSAISPVEAEAESKNGALTLSEVPPAAGSSASVTISARVAPTINIEGGKVESNVPVTIVRGQGVVTYTWAH